MKIFRFVIAGLFLVSISACDPEADIQKFIQDVRAQFRSDVKAPKDLKDEMTAAETPEKAPSAGELAKEHSELLSEMMKVIFDETDVENKTNFGELANTLNQGASLEGIYRGIIMGSRYRALETKSQAAGPMELKAFAIEMAELQDSMKSPTVFETDEAKKAPSIDYPDGSVGVPAPDNQTVTKKKEKAELRNELLQTFIGASGYTLKRTLGDEALKKIDEMKNDSGDLAQWYARFVLRMCDSKVDFGLDLRNKPDFDLHFKFAQKMALDRVRWEVLNRYHRYLNFTAKQK